MDSFENRSSTESKYIDYLYEDNEDYSSNVDYTVGPDFFTKAATADTPVNPLHQLLAYSHYFLFYDGSHFLGFVSQGLLILFLWTTAYFVLNLDLPGNPNGKLWPIYIPEHYGERNSQHLLDPYRYVFLRLKFAGKSDHPTITVLSILDTVCYLTTPLELWMAMNLLSNMSRIATTSKSTKQPKRPSLTERKPREWECCSPSFWLLFLKCLKIVS